MSRPTYLNRAYDVINNLGLSRLHPEDRNDIAIAFFVLKGDTTP